MNHVTGFIVGNFFLIFISLALLLVFQWDIINGETNTGENSRQREVYQTRHKRSIVIQNDDLHNFICWKYGHGSLSQEFKQSSSAIEKCTGPSVASRDVSNYSRYTVCAQSNDDDYLHKYYCQCENLEVFSLAKNKCTTDYDDYLTSVVTKTKKLHSFKIYDLMESPFSSRLSGKFSLDLSSECQFTGKFPLENFCDRYIQCLPGPFGTFEAYVHQCPPGKEYSKNYRLCMHPHLARCPYKRKPENYNTSSSTASPEVILSSTPSTSSTPVPYEVPLETSNQKISPGGYYEESSKPDTLTAPLSNTPSTTTGNTAPYVTNVTTNFYNSEMPSSSNTTNGTISYPDTIETSTEVSSSPPSKRNRTAPFQYTEQIPPTYEDYNPELPNENFTRESPEDYNLRMNGPSQPVFPGNVTTYEDEIPKYYDPGDEIVKQLHKYYQMDIPNGNVTYNKTGGRLGQKYIFKDLSFNYTDIEPKYDPAEDIYYNNETSTDYHSDPLYENQEPPVYNDPVPVYNPDDDPPIPGSVYSNTYEKMDPSYYSEPSLYDPELEESFKEYPPSPPGP
ncbi:unnamed protein product [Allacma fusca]|uniref:Chitin-binding type-2 domain-containing protein n=1 Tax=Allacma fusca TaxID=39272 RepID=A0A8J2P0M8_9HEXA|nr:unnamed protein product [Allacma fusca]